MINHGCVRAKVKETFELISIDVDQFRGETLEVWQERSDGFYFVYSDRLEIGYWVHPRLIEINI